MNIVRSKGFDYYFEPSKCEDCGGKCCRGGDGFIWLDENNIKEIALFLGYSVDELKKGCIKEVNGRFSIKERQLNGEKLCFFFDENSNKCSIYEVRPNQCRTFPFWEEFKKNRKSLEQECLAIKY